MPYDYPRSSPEYLFRFIFRFKREAETRPQPPVCFWLGWMSIGANRWAPGTRRDRSPKCPYAFRVSGTVTTASWIFTLFWANSFSRLDSKSVQPSPYPFQTWARKQSWL